MKLLQKIKKMSKKGQLGSIASIFVGLATIAIIAVVTFLLISTTRTQIASVEGLPNLNITNCQSSIACNATDTLAGSMDDAISFVPLIVVAAIGAALLSLVALFRRRG